MSSAMEGAAIHLPVKRSRPGSARAVNGGGGVSAAPGPLTAGQVDKAMIGKWLREDLEDRYLNLCQDHAKLKEKFRQQDDKIRDFKLVLKKKRDEIRQLKVQGGASAAELRATDQVVKLELRNAELEKQNEQLQQRLSVLQASQSGRAPRASGVAQHRVAGGPNSRVLQPHPQHPQQQQQQRQRSLGRSDDMRNEQTRLQLANGQLMAELDSLKEKLYSQEMEHRRRLQDLQSELEVARMQAGADKRSTMQEDLDKVRLQRELREKSAIIEQLQARCEAHEDRMRETVESNSRLVEEMERMKRELRLREREAETAKESSSSAQAVRRRIMELEHALDDANKEAHILKEANEKLTSSAFDTERERQWKTRELALMTQIKQLEATMHRDVGEKGEFLDRLEDERNKGEQVEKELSGLRIRYYELQQKHETLRDKMKFFNKESAVDLDEVEEALVLVKQRREQKQPSQLDFLHQVDAEVSKDSQRRLREIEAAHADTIQELEKTRQLLDAQYRINQDLKASLGLTERRLESVRTDHEAKMAESAKLLDIRAARIRKLERQLRDVAYGTKQFALVEQQQQQHSAEADGVDEVDETVHLRNGENLVEFHLGRLALTEEGVQLMGGDSEPALFFTWAFYICEMQTSEVMRGAAPDFDKTVQYVIKVDDAFLHYINKEKVKLELFRAVGVSYQSVAACRVSCRELLDSKPTSPVSGRATLLTPDGGTPVGTIDYWVRMRVPMEQAMRLYRERAKALGYMSANHQAAAEGLKALDELAEGRRPGGGANSLSVKIVRCRGLHSRRPDFQPTPYCSYKFFDCDDALSPAIPNSCDPEFHFHQLLTLTPCPALDKYLKTQKLVVWVLDEADPDQSAFLGVARVDLVSLSQNRAVQGTYQLYGPGDQPNGTLELEMGWQFAYAPSDYWDGTGAAEPLPLMTGEADMLRQRTTAPGAASVSVSVTVHEQPSLLALSTDSPTAGPRQPRPQPQPPQQAQQPQQPPRPQQRRAAGSSSAASSQGQPTPTERSPAHVGSTSPPKPSSRSGSVTGGEPIQQATPATPPTPQRRPQASVLAAAAAERRMAAGDVQASQTHVSTLMDASVTDSVTSITDTRDVRNGSLAPSTSQQTRPADSHEVDAEEYEEDYEEAESDDVVTEGAPDADFDGQQQQQLLTATGRSTMDSCTVQIFSVQFDESCPMLANPDLDDTKCFVAFQLPGYDGSDEVETPLSLPTPRPGGRTRPGDFRLNFNFQRAFDYSFDRNYEKRQMLALKLMADTVEIPFTVVCESADSQSEFFQDLGRASVRLDNLIAGGEEIREESFPLTLDGLEVGSIKISTNLPSLLLEVYDELPDRKKPAVKFVD